MLEDSTDNMVFGASQKKRILQVFLNSPTHKFVFLEINASFCSLRVWTFGYYNETGAAVKLKVGCVNCQEHQSNRVSRCF